MGMERLALRPSEIIAADIGCGRILSYCLELALSAPIDFLEPLALTEKQRR
jgi:hypothetical protein